jgi:hypothetical protein
MPIKPREMAICGETRSLGVIRESSVPSLGEPQASAHRAMLPSVDTSLQGGASIKKKREKIR